MCELVMSSAHFVVRANEAPDAQHFVADHPEEESGGVTDVYRGGIG
jgi:hypothetical protein